MHTPRAVAVSVPVFMPPSLLSESVRTIAATAKDLDIPPGLAALDEPLYLLCSSRKHPERCVLPKGGIEKGESSIEAALREGWEEAGFRGLHLLSLGPSIADRRPSKPSHKAEEIPRATYDFELCLVTKIEANWPEKDERTRRWCTHSEVRQLATWRAENVEGLDRIPADLNELVAIVSGKLRQENNAQGNLSG